MIFGRKVAQFSGVPEDHRGLPTLPLPTLNVNVGEGRSTGKRKPWKTRKPAVVKRQACR
ncbi:hypothetical protein ZHAS_00017029 [Anopheles sinensis]|uniref:Uncharacterized protein n=1 Tax=Anopheles sinensis TaxID=74873 RepID=A0A084WFM6_ANOSI|nr:hypothetical protein ZHAS_00017029 [Anopheles sinensis]